MCLRIHYLVLGSYALLGSVVPRDATVAAKLRDAGAVCLLREQIFFF
jgi:Asp-tRNA(Asn)/Glu-tRNA(Gln) amidotransferase A subunit family amidase